jgi:hypothetical protein
MKRSKLDLKDFRRMPKAGLEPARQNPLRHLFISILEAPKWGCDHECDQNPHATHQPKVLNSCSLSRPVMVKRLYIIVEEKEHQQLLKAKGEQENNPGTTLS